MSGYVNGKQDFYFNPDGSSDGGGVNLGEGCFVYGAPNE